MTPLASYALRSPCIESLPRSGPNGAGSIHCARSRLRMSVSPRHCRSPVRSVSSSLASARPGTAMRASTRRRPRSPVARATPAISRPLISDHAALASSASGSRAKTRPLAPAIAQLPASAREVPELDPRAGDRRGSADVAQVRLGAAGRNDRQRRDLGLVDHERQPAGQKPGGFCVSGRSWTRTETDDAVTLSAVIRPARISDGS